MFAWGQLSTQTIVWGLLLLLGTIVWEFSILFSVRSQLVRYFRFPLLLRLGVLGRLSLGLGVG